MNTLRFIHLFSTHSHNFHVLLQVLGLGVSPERIIFAHPCRPASHLRYAKEQQVVNGTVDNEYEIYKLRKHYPDSK